MLAARLRFAAPPDKVTASADAKADVLIIQCLYACPALTITTAGVIRWPRLPLLNCRSCAQLQANRDGGGTWFDLSRQTVQPRWQRRRHALPELPAAAHIESRVLRAGSPNGHGSVTSACMRVSGEPTEGWGLSGSAGEATALYWL